MKLALIATAAALTLGSGVAVGQTAPERGATVTRDAMVERAGARFDRRDANGDGVLNAADRAARADRMFARLDTDGDGAISRAEWDAMRERRGDRRALSDRGARGDRAARRVNGDRSVSRAEAVAAASARFDRADADRDGSVTRDERRAARTAGRAGR